MTPFQDRTSLLDTETNLGSTTALDCDPYRQGVEILTPKQFFSMTGPYVSSRGLTNGSNVYDLLDKTLEIVIYGQGEDIEEYSGFSDTYELKNPNDTIADTSEFDLFDVEVYSRKNTDGVISAFALSTKDVESIKKNFEMIKKNNKKCSCNLDNSFSISDNKIDFFQDNPSIYYAYTIDPIDVSQNSFFTDAPITSSLNQIIRESYRDEHFAGCGSTYSSNTSGIDSMAFGGLFRWKAF